MCSCIMNGAIITTQPLGGEKSNRHLLERLEYRTIPGGVRMDVFLHFSISLYFFPPNVIRNQQQDLPRTSIPFFLFPFCRWPQGTYIFFPMGLAPYSIGANNYFPFSPSSSLPTPNRKTPPHTLPFREQKTFPFSSVLPLTLGGEAKKKWRAIMNPRRLDVVPASPRLCQLQGRRCGSASQGNKTTRRLGCGSPKGARLVR